MFLICALLFFFSGVLNGPDIRKLKKSEQFTAALTKQQRAGWIALKDFIATFLCKNRAEKPVYDDARKRMLREYEKSDVNMSLKIHFIHHHMEYFEKQLSTESDEQGERYHQVAIPFETR